jgi:hypothetical protein
MRRHLVHGDTPWMVGTRRRPDGDSAPQVQARGTMTALVRYLLGGLGASQRYLPPALLFVIAVTVVTSSERASLAPSYSFCALAQFICMTWLTVVLANTENPVQRAMTTVAAHGSHRVLLANVWAAVLASVALMVFGLVIPVVLGASPVTVSAVMVGVVAQLTGGLSGIAVGLVCSRLVVPRSGYALFAAFGLILVMVLVPWVPPINPMLRLVSSDLGTDHSIVALGIYAGVSVAILAVSMVVTHHIARRHE